MKYYLAPMEGITGYIYRNLYHEFFHNVDKYFTPFVSPNQNHCLQKKELKDIAPKHNQGMVVVPQILTNRSDYFTETEKMMQNTFLQEQSRRAHILQREESSVYSLMSFLLIIFILIFPVTLSTLL